MKKLISIVSSFFLLVTVSSFSPICQAAAQPPTVNGQPALSLSGMLQKIMPSVVNVAAQGEIPAAAAGNQADNDNSAPENHGPRRFTSMGSGVVVDAANGYILTNVHVLRDAQIFTVTLSDGRVFKAKLIGMDPASDVAVVQIKADKLTALQFGNSDVLKVGDFVAAIGNPFGLNQTVTSGIVSALERSGLGIEGYENFIQTDASINPGNSGGALVNMQGQLIGINTAIFSPAGGNVGIGFAIPVNMARSVMAQLIKYGSVNRGLIGVLVQDFTPALASAFQDSGKTGALIAQIAPNSPAAKAGLKPGDLIQAVGNTPVTNAAQIRNAIGMLRVGSEVKLQVLRNGSLTTFTLATADPQKYFLSNQLNNPFLYGVTLRSFDEITPNQGRVIGLQLVDIAENSMAWRAGLRRGDVVLSANGKSTANLIDLQQVAQQSKQDLLLNVFRVDGTGEFLVIKKPQD